MYKIRNINLNVSIFAMLCAIWLFAALFISPVNALKNVTSLFERIDITQLNGEEFTEAERAAADADFKITLTFQRLADSEDEIGFMSLSMPDGVELYSTSGQSDKGSASYEARTDSVKIEFLNHVSEDEMQGEADLTDTIQLNAHFSEDIADYISEDGTLALEFEDVDTQIEIPFEETKEPDTVEEWEDNHEEQSDSEVDNDEPRISQSSAFAAADPEVQDVLTQYGNVVYKEVGTFSELQTALTSLNTATNTITHIKFTSSITATAATSMIGSASDTASNSFVKGNFMLDGDGKYSLDMRGGAIMLSDSYSLYVYNLTLKQEFTNGTISSTLNTGANGLFCIAGGGGASANIQWNATFYNLNFRGSALVGAYQVDTVSNNRRFENVMFAGETKIHVEGYRSRNAVILCRNTTIEDDFIMTGSPTVTTLYDAMLRPYFASANTRYSSDIDYEYVNLTGSYNNTISAGTFCVAEGAVVNITRNPSGYSYGPNNTLYYVTVYQDLIRGYQNYEFEDNSEFYAKGGTNQYVESPTLRWTSAVIKSVNVKKFFVGNGAQVKLEADRASSHSTNSNYYGYTALYLGKREHMDFTVSEGAELTVTSAGVAGTAVSARRGMAPIVVMDSGSSTTNIHGTLNINSKTGNGWYYEYQTSQAGKQIFQADGKNAVVDINAESSSRANAEYAGFEGYGNYEVEIGVYNGATMDVYTKGKRGISLAASSSKKSKAIKVDGEGSSLTVSGIVWAIAAEGQSDLSITATNHGVIRLSCDGEVGESYPSSGDAPSTIYGVGRTTILADTYGEITVYHRGGNYSAIFQDGGPLRITVDNGAKMNVDNYNSGDAYGSRRAAITVQSPVASASIWDTATDSFIKVKNSGTLSVRSHNNEIHSSGTYPQQQFAMGAINFGGVAGGTNGGGHITVTDGGNFYAISDSPTPTIFLNYGTITFDNPGDFEIRNDSDEATVVTRPNLINPNPYSGYVAAEIGADVANVGQAVYIGYASASMKVNLNLTANVVFFKNTDVTVWQVNKHHTKYSGGNYVDREIDTYWKDTNISASIASIATASNNGRIVTPTTNVLGKWTTTGTTDADGNKVTNQFALQAYGRIMGGGEGSERNTNLILEKEVSTDKAEEDDEFTYTINVNNSWLENVTSGSDGGIGIIEGNDTVWKNVVLTDELDYQLDFAGYDTGKGYTITTAPGTDKDGNTITILTIKIDEVKASEVFEVSFKVKVNDNAVIGEIIYNQATVDGLEDLIYSNIVETVVIGEISRSDGIITKVSDAEDGEAYIGTDFTYTITARNSGTAAWTDVTATDQLPAELQYISFASSDGVTLAHDGSGGLTLNFGDVAQGSEKVIVISVRVKKDAEPDKIIYNTVTTNDGETDTDDGTKILAIGSIKVEKYGKDDKPLAGAEFTIEQYDSDNDVWIYIKWDDVSRSWTEDNSSSSKYSQTTELNGTSTLADTVFAKLDPGQYRITEVASPEGYTTLAEPFIGTIPTLDNDNKPVYDITFTVYNDQVLEMPVAGIGITPAMLLLLGLGIISIAAKIYLSVREYRQAAEIQ